MTTASKQRESLFFDRVSSILISYRENMYKKRFKQWNARKYNEESEMKAIVRKTVERTAVGKASTFNVRGKVVDSEEAIRYWERKNKSIAEVLTRRPTSKTPEAVRCLTPLQSPLRTPEVLATPERILVTIQDYIRGCSDAGKWSESSKGVTSALSQLSDQCYLAIYLFGKNRCLEAGQVLNSAFANIKKVLRSEHPSTFRHFFMITSDMFKESRPELALAMLRQVSSMAEVLLGNNHPFKLVCMWLASLGQRIEALYQDILSVSLQKMGDCFEQVLGPMSETTLFCRLSLAEEFESKRDLKRVEGMYRKLLLDCELSLGEHNNRTLQVHQVLAYNLYRQSNFIEAKEIYGLVFDYAPRSSLLKGYSLEQSAYCQYYLGDTQGAVATLRETIHLAQSGELFMGDGKMCSVMLHLENWLAELGEFHSAAEVQETRLKLQDSMRVEFL